MTDAIQLCAYLEQPALFPSRLQFHCLLPNNKSHPHIMSFIKASKNILLPSCYPQNNLFTHLLPDMVVAFPFLHWVKKVVITAIPRNDTNIKLRQFFGCSFPMDVRNSDKGFDPQPTNSLALTCLYFHHVLFFIVSLPSFH
jgi:hypothetical protein